MYDGSRIVRDVRIKKIRLNLHFHLAAMKANNFFLQEVLFGQSQHPQKFWNVFSSEPRE